MSNEIWLPIVEYSAVRGVSISSVRRYIKANRVKYRKIEGKYFILLKNPDKYQDKLIALDQQNLKNSLTDKASQNLNGSLTEISAEAKTEKDSTIKKLRQEIQRLREENQELKMLVDLYENKSNKSNKANDTKSVTNRNEESINEEIPAFRTNTSEKKTTNLPELPGH